MPVDMKSPILVSPATKRRLEEMRVRKENALGSTRIVTFGEIVSDLLAEHDKATEAEPI